MKLQVVFSVFILVFAASETFASITCGSDGTYLTTDCSSFYQCANGVPYLYHCVPTLTGKLVSNPSFGRLSEYNCTISANTSETAEPTDRDRTYLLHPDDCRSLFQDANGVVNPLGSCPYTHDRLMDPSPSVCFGPTKNNCAESVAAMDSPLALEPPERRAEPPCGVYNHPTACLRSPNNCSFCFDTRLRDGTVGVVRCDKYDNLLHAGCRNFKPDQDEYDSVVETSPRHSYWFLLEPRRKRRFSVTFSLEKQPLDLYYLMDFSSSMSDDKRKLVSLSSDLLKTLANLTDDFHVGFGTFVDKPVFPFGESGDYSFHNDFPLTAHTDGLVGKIRAAPIKKGADGPEAHAVALAQIIQCTDEIGWRNNARHVVLLATDTHFHLEGDGRKSRPPISAPYVEGCYLDSLGAYTEDLTMDYPSLAQLAKAFSKKQATTSVIFATSSDTVSFYKDVAANFKSAYVGVLKEDSSNVLELIKEEFAKIDSKMEIESSAPSDLVSFKYFSNCLNSDVERETAICEHLPQTGEVTFIVEMDLATCRMDMNEHGMVFILNPVGLPIFLEVELSYLCD